MSDSLVQRLDSGIIRVDFGAHPVLSMPVLEAAFERVVALGPGKHPILIRVGGVSQTFAEGRAYAVSDRVADATLACAWVGQWSIGKTLFELWMLLSKPSYAARWFDDEDQARAWLLLQVAQAS